MVISNDASFRSPGSVELVERPMGRNTVGVVAWLLLLRTPECPQGRQVSTAASQPSVMQKVGHTCSVTSVVACLPALWMCLT